VIPQSEYLREQDIPYITSQLLKKYHTDAECKAFAKWFYGQTGIITEAGELGVYTWDYERWLAGLPNID
jgi:hypothetical protein